MATMAEGRMNLATLQQRDPYIVDIIGTATQVALYSFSPKANEWEKTSIEGTLFVYARSASPTNGFMILNRLGLNNLIQPITKDLEFQQHAPFLLYKNAKTIYGIWFYEKDECSALGSLMSKLVETSGGKHEVQSKAQSTECAETTPSLGPRGAADTGQVDIMKMLSQAQLEYNKTKSSTSKSSEPKPLTDNPNAAATKKSSLIRPTPLRANGHTPQSKTPSPSQLSTTPTGAISVETLFRNAISQQQSGIPTTQSVPVPGKSSRPQRSISLSEDSTKQSDHMPHMLQHLMSTGPTLEEIERHQRGEVTLKINVDSNLPVSTASQSQQSKSPSSDIVSSQLKNQKSSSAKTSPVHKHSSASLLDVQSDQAVSDHSLSPCTGDDKSPQLSPHTSGSVEGGTGALGNVGSSDSSSSKNSQFSLTENLLTPADLCQFSNQPGALSTAAAALAPDVLLSPLAFTSSTKNTTEPSLPVFNLTAALSEDSQQSVPSVSKGGDAEPFAPLTKEQLQQALLYLMRNDSSFITQIHEAYLKSLKGIAKPK